ncbi:hypothetical protein K474DRAFT_549974 [Panus rudis PR-1116 ss-1]|nr:hypothetical protein K474DRAFT_549974 [Panus rudis PR-1116 ss-1]
MTSLPSFVELMASLGLDNKAEPTDSIVTPPQPNLYANGSPAIVISRHSSSSTLSDRELDTRRHKARFSPYSPPISHVRRGSMPVLSSDEKSAEQPSRAFSTSPAPLLKARTVGRRSSALGLTSSRRPEKLNLSDPDLIANTPISTFVRRKTPSSSPISPTFPHRRRAASPAAPVTIPQLPTFVFPPPQANASLPSDTEDDDMGVTPRIAIHADIPAPSQSLRPRPLRSARHSDSNISFRPSPALESYHSPSVTSLIA